MYVLDAIVILSYGMTVGTNVIYLQIDTVWDTLELLGLNNTVMILGVVTPISVESGVVMHTTPFAGLDCWGAHIELGLMEFLDTRTGDARVGGCTEAGVGCVLVLTHDAGWINRTDGGSSNTIRVIVVFGTAIAAVIRRALSAETGDSGVRFCAEEGVGCVLVLTLDLGSPGGADTRRDNTTQNIVEFGTVIAAVTRRALSRHVENWCEYWPGFEASLASFL
jgi:hypothetical protein